MLSRSQTVAIFAYLLGFVVSACAAAADDGKARARGELQARHDKAVAESRAKLEALADRLDKENAAEPAKRVRAAILAPQGEAGADRYYPVIEYSRSRPAPAEAPNESAKVAAAETELAEIRTATAETIHNLALEAGKAGLYSSASIWLHEVLAQNPDHAGAREMLGFHRYQDGWATSFAMRMLKRNRTLHPTFGWIDRGWVEHLEAGELPVDPDAKGPVRWVSADEADQLHSAISNPWNIYTEHFAIKSTAKLADVITFGRRLEILHDVFTMILAENLDMGVPLVAKFGGKTRVPVEKPHEIYYLASKEEYLSALQSRNARADERSLGIYIDGLRTSFFYQGASRQISDVATLAHESAHQMLAELSIKTSATTNPGDFWVNEGFGTYFETLLPQEDGSVLLGGLAGPRIEQARSRIVDKGELIPLAKFVRLNNDRFVRTDDLGDIFLKYAQAMALAVFLMQSESRKYRPTFLEYVIDAHKGRLRVARPRTLTMRLGVDYDTLDREFVAYLKGE